MAKLQWDRNTEATMGHYNVFVNGVKQATVPQVALGAIPEWLIPLAISGNLTVTAVNTSGAESGASVSVPFSLVPPAVPLHPRLV